MVLWTIVIFGLAAIHEGILGPAVACFGPNYDMSMLLGPQVRGCCLPRGQVGVVVRLWVSCNVTCRGVTGRIASDDLIVLILIYPHVVETHCGWHQWAQTSQIQLREPVRHAEVHDHGHWLFWNKSLTDIAVRT